MVLLLPAVLGVPIATAQIDPVKRELVQLGYNQPLEGSAPIAGYAFYYYNQPGFLRTNLTLRLAIAPVYADSELGFSGLLGPNTDLGVGLAGGGFADSYYEFREGKYLKSESFDGNGGLASASIYHLFDPGRLIPLYGVLRNEIGIATYVRNDDTAPNFALPPNRGYDNVRVGFRFGGQEPLLAPDLAMELSVWYEGMFRFESGPYGFVGDRQVNPASHLFWGRALLAYTLPERKDNFLLSITSGLSADVDRFSAYRIGGILPLASEFPLSIPGYFYQELSASRFALVNGTYYLPLDPGKRWELTFVGTTSIMDYAPGQAQPGHWNSGVGGGITYRSHSKAWKITLDYGYGFNAIRSHGRGGQSIGILIQFDLAKTKGAPFTPTANPDWTRSFQRLFQSFQ